MTKIAITLIPGLLLGWWGAPWFIDEAPSLREAPRQNRISILGGGTSPSTPFSEVSGFINFASAQEILTRIEFASSAELKGWLKEMMKSSHVTDELIQAVVTHLMEMDPKEGFAFIKAERFPNEYLTPALIAWAKIDVSSAIQEAFVHDPSGKPMYPMMEGLDAQARWDFYKELFEGDHDVTTPSVFVNLFHLLAENDPEGAARAALEFSLRTELGYGDRCVENAVTSWFGKDPEEAFRWANGIEDPVGRKRAIEGFARVALRSASNGVKGLDLVWSHLDEEQRQKIVAGQPYFDSGYAHYWDQLDDKVRKEFIEDRQTSEEDLDTLIGWIDANVDSPVLHGQMLGRLMEGIARSEHFDKLAGIFSRVDSDFAAANLASQFEGISQRWAAHDPEGFQEWADSLEDPVLRDVAEKGLLAHWASEDPLKVIEHWEENGYVEAPHTFHAVLQELILNQVEKFDSSEDPQALFDRLPEALQGKAAMIHAQFPKDSPEEVVNLIAGLPQGFDRDQALQKGIGDWAGQNPTQASEWVSALEEGEAKDLAARNLVNSWARFDLNAAQAWVEDMPPSIIRDRAANEVITFAAEYQPESAFDLALSIGDIGIRKLALEDVILNLARQNPDQADELTKAASISSEWSEVIEQERKLKEHFRE